MKTEQAKQLTNEALDQLARALEAGQSDTLQSFLRAMSHFHSYSVGNLFLILAQRPDATRVAGFRAWKKLGRFVRRGEKGIAIVAPMRIKPKDERTRRREHHPAPDSAEEESFLRFRIAHVFDVSQTEGEPLPEFARVTGDPGVYLTRLQAFAESRGTDVRYEHIPGSAEGYSSGGQIVVQEGLTPSVTCSILAHELAHEFLHQGDRNDRPSKTVRETEAEAVAFVVCQAIGLECGTAASDYIQLYCGDAETLSSSLARIQRTAAEMIAAIEDAADEEDANRKAA